MTRGEATEAIEYIKKYRELDTKLYTTPSRNFTIVSKNVVNKYLGYWDMAIKALEQQSKTGHWEWVQYDGNPSIGNWHCSVCNRIVYRAIKAADPVYAYKYCPNCGATMAERSGDE